MERGQLYRERWRLICGWGSTATAALSMFCASCLLEAAWAAPGGFTFSTPPGWLNISPDAPEAERHKAPSELLAVVNAGSFAFYAIDLESGRIASVNAIVKAGKPPLITASLLDDMEDGVRREVGKQGLTYRAIKKEVVKVAGVTAAHLVGDIPGAEAPLRTAQYAVPGEAAVAIITFSAPPDKFVRYEPIFEASVQAIQGAREATGGWPLSSVVTAGMMGAVAAIVAAHVRKKLSRSPQLS